MSGREALTAERLASARAQAESALAGCAFCGRPHKDPDTAMHAPVPYVLEVPASEMLELLDWVAVTHGDRLVLMAAMSHIRSLSLDVPLAHNSPESFYRSQVADAIGTAQRALDIIASAQRGGEGS